MSNWIEFLDPHASETGKTWIWPIATKPRGAMLGEVRWFSRWRRYAFFPLPGTVFEQDCLRDIAEFCELQTAGRKAVSA